MSRPLRIQFPGALYHVTARGNERRKIYKSDQDRIKWLEIFTNVCRRYNWVCYSYCLMGNHYHLMIETPDANLSEGMRQLNSLYTRYFNSEHTRVGHLFQGRFASPLIEKEAHLLELSRYIILNPVRAYIVDQPGEWFWSSYRATIGLGKTPPWLGRDWLLSQFGLSSQVAVKEFEVFVAAGKTIPNPLENIKHQIYLGSDVFVEEVQRWVADDAPLAEIPSAQKRPVVKPLDEFAAKYCDRKMAMAMAYLSGGYSMREISEYFSVHYVTVGRAVRWYEQQKNTERY